MQIPVQQSPYFYLVPFKEQLADTTNKDRIIDKKLFISCVFSTVSQKPAGILIVPTACTLASMRGECRTSGTAGFLAYPTFPGRSCHRRHTKSGEIRNFGGWFHFCCFRDALLVHRCLSGVCKWQPVSRVRKSEIWEQVRVNCRTGTVLSGAPALIFRKRGSRFHRFMKPTSGRTLFERYPLGLLVVRALSRQQEVLQQGFATLPEGKSSECSLSQIAGKTTAFLTCQTRPILSASIRQLGNAGFAVDMEVRPASF
jgi:hypothetical protein